MQFLIYMIFYLWFFTSMGCFRRRNWPFEKGGQFLEGGFSFAREAQEGNSPFPLYPHLNVDIKLNLNKNFMGSVFLRAKHFYNSHFPRARALMSVNFTLILRPLSLSNHTVQTIEIVRAIEC